MRCPKCRHENDSDADFCSSCGATLDSSGSLLSLNKTLVLVIIVLSSILAVYAGYNYFSNDNQNQTPQILNKTQNANNITWTPEYISFDKAKSIAIEHAAPDVTVSDPILMKNEKGTAIYVCYYYYEGYMVGGIIIDAKTGNIIYKEQNIPNNSYQKETNKDYYDYDYNEDLYYEDDYYYEEDTYYEDDYYYDDYYYDDYYYDDYYYDDYYYDDYYYDDYYYGYG